VWHIAIFGCTAKIGRNRGMPDIAGQLSARSGRERHKATDPGCLLSGRYRGISAGFELRESPIRNPAQILIQCRARNGMASVVVTYLGLFFRQTRSRAATHFTQLPADRNCAVGFATEQLRFAADSRIRHSMGM
jgi:hypothetical protein